MADPFGIKLTFTEEQITLDCKDLDAQDLRDVETLTDRTGTRPRPRGDRAMQDSGYARPRKRLPRTGGE
jgi:hypothetical protein